MKKPGLEAGALIALLACSWAAPLLGAAHSAGFRSAQSGSSGDGLPSGKRALPAPARLQEGRGRGLLVDVWVNGAGPYIFAVDTGAGTTLIRSEIADRAGLTPISVRRTEITGLSNSGIVSGEQVVIENVALGESNNLLPSRQRAFIVPRLPSGVDGILDPTKSYAPFGYVIDMPKRQLLAFDTSINRLKMGNDPVDGAIVAWVREKGDSRPFVRLGDNRLALIDTGSGFGLAIPQRTAAGPNHRTAGNRIRDVGGGAVESTRVAPTTVTIGSLVLRGVPTDILTGADVDVPVILGRDALYPFRLTFDPASRLIEIRES